MNSRLRDQFRSLEQQAEAARQGLWIFLGSEMLFFGAMMLAYTVYRQTYPQAFAQVSRQLSWLLGTMNTAVLLTSSLTMALAVRGARQMRLKELRAFLGLTLLLGLAFLAIKGFEYAGDFKRTLFLSQVAEPTAASATPRQILLFLYYLMTAIHALHLFIGICAVGTVLVGVARARSFTRGSDIPVEAVGLYWHFVDIVWIFLYPMFYLVGRPTP